MTPISVERRAKAARWHEEQDFMRLRLLAYLTANLSRAKRLPNIHTFLNPPKTRAISEQEAEELREETNMMAAELEASLKVKGKSEKQSNG